MPNSNPNNPNTTPNPPLGQDVVVAGGFDFARAFATKYALYFGGLLLALIVVVLLADLFPDILEKGSKKIEAITAKYATWTITYLAPDRDQNGIRFIRRTQPFPLDPEWSKGLGENGEKLVFSFRSPVDGIRYDFRLKRVSENPLIYKGDWGTPGVEEWGEVESLQFFSRSEARGRILYHPDSNPGSSDRAYTVKTGATILIARK